MLREEDPSPLDAALPHEPCRSEAQVRGVMELLTGDPMRVLDLGCGDGRLLAPIARHGHHVTGIDRDRAAIDHCRSLLRECAGRAELIEAEFLQWMIESNDACSFDAILCLGNTFMTIADLDEAVEALAHAARLLAPGGMFILDDLPHDLWPQLTEGDWTAGISADGSTQLVWHADDSLFTIRRGERVNPDSWTLEDGDEAYRMWTSGALRLAGRLAGLSEPQHLAPFGLLVLRRPDSAIGVK